MPGLLLVQDTLLQSPASNRVRALCYNCFVYNGAPIVWTPPTPPTSSYTICALYIMQKLVQIFFQEINHHSVTTVHALM
jgi:hypothetical protein